MLPAADPAADGRRRYWRSQIRRIVILLVIWAVVAFGMSILFVEQLNTISLGGVPLGFWMAQQGSIFIFVLLILVYAITSDRADRKAGVQEATGTTTSAGLDH